MNSTKIPIIYQNLREKGQRNDRTTNKEWLKVWSIAGDMWKKIYKNPIGKNKRYIRKFLSLSSRNNSLMNLSMYTLSVYNGPTIRYLQYVFAREHGINGFTYTYITFTTICSISRGIVFESLQYIITPDAYIRSKVDARKRLPFIKLPSENFFCISSPLLEYLFVIVSSIRGKIPLDLHRCLTLVGSANEIN